MTEIRCDALRPLSDSRAYKNVSPTQKVRRTLNCVNPIDKKGNVLLQYPIRLATMRRALVIVLEDKPNFHISETALLSELVLAKDWNRPEEDEAWAHLQHEPLS